MLENNIDFKKDFAPLINDKVPDQSHPASAFNYYYHVPHILLCGLPKFDDVKMFVAKCCVENMKFLATDLPGSYTFNYREAEGLCGVV